MHFKNRLFPFLLSLFLCSSPSAYAQMITGVWKGKIGNQRVVVKIIQNGDSLTGTSYYTEPKSQLRRYSIKGYFDKNTNEAIWWDDALIDIKTGRSNQSYISQPALISTADFNCPGGGRMMLDGKSADKKNPSTAVGNLHLDKTEISSFRDEWDPVIENYTTGANDPFIIDSVQSIAGIIQAEPEISIVQPKITPITKPVQDDIIFPEINNVKQPVTTTIPKPIEKKFIERTKVFTKEIPVSGDTIEMRFYDNAEVDGDSISLFLNDKLVFEHIRLTAVAYKIKLALSDLKEINELVMVAENLGSIPPNTSYMIAEVNGVRYEARLASTEGSSAMIRLVKTSPSNFP